MQRNEFDVREALKWAIIATLAYSLFGWPALVVTVLFVMNDNPVTLEALLYGINSAAMII